MSGTRCTWIALLASIDVGIPFPGKGDSLSFFYWALVSSKEVDGWVFHVIYDRVSQSSAIIAKKTLSFIEDRLAVVTDVD